MRIVMMGTGVFAEPTFEALLARRGGDLSVVGLFTQPDRGSGSERGSTRQTGRGMAVIAAEAGIVVHRPESINTPDGVALLRDLSPDLLVVAAYGQILSAEVLGVPRLGGINVHASLLPKYRGAAPINWAIYHGETRVGVTIIRMSVGLDAGNMLAQESVALGPDDTAGDAEQALSRIGATMAVDVAVKLAAGPVTGVKQDPALVTKAPKLRKEHGLLDFARTAEQVRAQVRAMHPWPTPYTFWLRDGQRPLRLIAHRVGCRAASPAEAGEPGDILPTSSKSLDVLAGGGTVVEIHELQPEGKRRMAAEEFLRGRKPQPGDRLGRGPS